MKGLLVITFLAKNKIQCHQIERNGTNPNKTIMEEEPESRRSCHKSLLELLCDSSTHNGFDVGTYIAVVILPQLSRSCGYKDRERKKCKNKEMEMVHSCG